ncbi:MAG TPA: flippase-like domain-containing protein [Candidatus Nitrosopolaris sp.]|nr:flippase-like domain-containing protein [Candidatus Nitrosopolaris sp.]
MPPPATAWTPEPSPGSSARTGRRVAAIVLGTVLLALLVSYAGLTPVLARFRALGWAAPLVLLPYLVINILDTNGWRCTLPATARVPFSSLYLVRMAGEAVNSMTPTVTVGGEPVKAHLLRAFGVSGSDALASVVIAKTALTVSQCAFVLVGLAVLFDRLERHAAGAVWVALLVLVCAAFTLLLVRLQRRRPASTAWRWTRRLAPRSAIVAGLEARAAAIDERLADFYRLERGSFLRAALWHFAGWMLGVLEVKLFMTLLGEPIGLRDALIVEALAQPIRAVALVIPGGIGAQEVGGVALCSFLGIPEAAGVALWLLKRARELVFDAVGLIYLTRRTAMHPRRAAL